MWKQLQHCNEREPLSQHESPSDDSYASDDVGVDPNPSVTGNTTPHSQHSNPTATDDDSSASDDVSVESSPFVTSNTTQDVNDQDYRSLNPYFQAMMPYVRHVEVSLKNGDFEHSSAFCINETAGLFVATAHAVSGGSDIVEITLHDVTKSHEAQVLPPMNRALDLAVLQQVPEGNHVASLLSAVPVSKDRVEIGDSLFFLGFFKQEPLFADCRVNGIHGDEIALLTGLPKGCSGGLFVNTDCRAVAILTSGERQSPHISYARRLDTNAVECFLSKFEPVGTSSDAFQSYIEDIRAKTQKIVRETLGVSTVFNRDHQVMYVKSITFSENPSGASGGDVRTGFKGAYIYPTIHWTDKIEEAVRGFSFVTGQGAPAPAGFERINFDLNKHARGTYNYLCITKNAAAGDPISKVTFLKFGSPYRSTKYNNWDVFPQDLLVNGER